MKKILKRLCTGFLALATVVRRMEHRIASPITHGITAKKQLKRGRRQSAVI